MFSFFSRPSKPTASASTDELQNSAAIQLDAGPPPATPSPAPPESLPPPLDVDINALHDLISSVPAKLVHQYVLERLEAFKEQPAASTEDGSVPPFDRDVAIHIAQFFKDLTSPPKLHCARCHADYFAVENNDRSCRIAHDDESAEVSRAEAFKDHTYETLWGCCGKTVEGDGDQGPPDGWCYEGMHTIDPRRARFRADSEPYPGNDRLASCEKMRCGQAGTTPRRRSGKRIRPSYFETDGSDLDAGPLLMESVDIIRKPYFRISDDSDTDHQSQSASVKSKTSKGGRKRRKVALHQETTSAMDVDDVNASASAKGESTKPLSGSSFKPQSRGTASPKSILKSKPVSKLAASSSPFPVAASGEEAEAEDTEPPSEMTKKKRSPKKPVACPVDDGMPAEGVEEQDVKKKRKKKRRTADAGDAPYKDEPLASTDEAEDHDFVEERKKPKKTRKSASRHDTEGDAMAIDAPAAKTPKSPKKPAAHAVTDQGHSSEKKPKRKKLLEVIQSSIPGEE